MVGPTIKFSLGGASFDVDQLELEGIAEAIIRAGGQEPDSPPKIAALVVAHLGENSVEYSNAVPGDAALVRTYDIWRIFVKRGLTPERRSFAIAHELLEWWFRVVENYRGADVEHAANYGAAAIRAPRRAFRRAVSMHGRDLPMLARTFRATETEVALREAEIDRLPRAVVSPALVRVRGPEEWIWPEESTIRRWAKASRVAGVRKVRLTDDPRRFVLDAEAPETA